MYLVPSLLCDCVRGYDILGFTIASRGETDATTAIGPGAVCRRGGGDFFYSPGLRGYSLVGNTIICITAAVLVAS